ncbi:hypothetical protein HYW76_01580 [Candidatus Pacearchaeota archaeon]|nr:hypothetical protein [Candidatus Pacearchaeota archaeon]
MVNKKSAVILVLAVVFISYFVSAFSLSDISGKITGYTSSSEQIVCLDDDANSDEFDIYTAGKVSRGKLKNGEIEKPKIKKDICTKKNQYVKEYYCEGNKVKFRNAYCINGCEEGACLEHNELYLCADIDIGEEEYNGEMYIAGKTVDLTSGDVFFDSCLSLWTVKEYYCGWEPANTNTNIGEDEVLSRNIDCSTRCSKGRCLPPPKKCKEMDKGIVPNKPGNLNININNRVYYYPDECIGESSGGTMVYPDINETFCEYDKVESIVIPCDGGCSLTPWQSSDVCNPVKSSCVDSDYVNGATNYTDTGAVLIVDDKGKITSQFDKCKNGNTLTEYSCNGASLTKQDVVCNNLFETGGKCVLGECKQTISKCYDNDTGDNRVSVGTIYINGEASTEFVDYCRDANTLVEYACRKLEKIPGCKVTPTNSCMIAVMTGKSNRFEEEKREEFSCNCFEGKCVVPALQ